jgi:hypothetical protein
MMDKINQGLEFMRNIIPNTQTFLTNLLNDLMQWLHSTEAMQLGMALVSLFVIWAIYSFFFDD